MHLSVYLTSRRESRVLACVVCWLVACTHMHGAVSAAVTVAGDFVDGIVLQLT